MFSKTLQHFFTLLKTLAGFNGQGRITLRGGTVLVSRDDRFELLTDEVVDGVARARAIGELATLLTTTVVASGGKYKGRPLQLLGTKGQFSVMVNVNVDGAILTTWTKMTSIGFWVGPNGRRRNPSRGVNRYRTAESALPRNILAILSRAQITSLIEAALPPPAAPPAIPQLEEAAVESQPVDVESHVDVEADAEPVAEDSVDVPEDDLAVGVAGEFDLDDDDDGSAISDIFEEPEAEPVDEAPVVQVLDGPLLVDDDDDGSAISDIFDEPEVEPVDEAPVVQVLDGSLLVDDDDDGSAISDIFEPEVEPVDDFEVAADAAAVDAYADDGSDISIGSIEPEDLKPQPPADAQNVISENGSPARKRARVDADDPPAVARNFRASVMWSATCQVREYTIGSTSDLFLTGACPVGRLRSL